MLGRTGTALVISVAALGTAWFVGAGAPPQQRQPPPAPAILVARTHPPAPATSVLAGTPDAVTASVARDLFASAPVVVVASASHPAVLAAAVSQAGRALAPLLLTSAPAGTGAASAAALRTQVRALHPRVVLAVGVAASTLSAQSSPAQSSPAQSPSGQSSPAQSPSGQSSPAQSPRIHVVTSPARLPETRAPAPLDHVVLLVHQGDSSAATTAAAATAHAAGAQVITVQGYDPMADPAAITALAAAKPRRVLAIGAGFGPVRQLSSRLAVAETGVQLPGGGQVLFPMRRLVALYGHPGAPSLGALGEQDLPASIARARRVARLYRKLSSVPVIPTFEIIATVAEAHPGADGSYSYESPLSLLSPWVRRATAAGMYVVLDLQAGRASLLAQAKRYEPLLELPNVGLALDPEWKLGPRQRPLRQIGSVSASQINGVGAWLAGLTARHHLPQKLLVLHQFQLSMIANERRLDTHYGDLAIVIHMDGQGTPRAKQKTWDAVTKAAPRGVFFGWKDFYTKDHPMLGPRQTIARSPRPVMISYQ